MSFRYLATLAVLASVALAKTDLDGCTSSDSVVTPANGGTPYATRVYFVPDTGEICAALDCGGGRAPPKTTVPGCPSYEGTETYSPSFLPIKTSASVPAQTSQAPVTTPAPGKTSVTAAVESSTAKDIKSEDIKSVTGTDTLLVVATSDAKPSNGTLSVTAKAGTRTATNGASGATTAATSVPNAAAPVGVSHMYGIAAGVALGAAVLL
ncbi:siderophore biosynthesis [Colletotrichum truncatum]|uniref:Siderophore biosynthesis n=1 Tax=Colletotrichum truncatum TaxID=5467 RepID=A0ACC3ZFF7_COLTU|nr:siderophore biosynthesis [Colletotrichum truncatum]KAF6801764.1 siderophore biosynthesis [Colletotrichum truncatum]